MTRSTLVRVVILAGMAAMAGLEFHRIFGWGPMLPRVLGAAVLAAGVPVVGLWSRPARPVAITVSASVVLLALYLATVTQVLAPVDTPGGLLDGIVNGWSRLLTTSIPAPPRGDLLTLPVIVTWVAALIAVEMAIRTRAAVGALAPSAAAYVIGLLFTVGTGETRWIPALVWVGGAVVSVRLAGTTNSRRPVEVARNPDPTARRAGVPIPVVAALVVVIAAGAFIGPRLPGSDTTDPMDPRESRDPPRQELESVNPMSLLAGWARSPEDELFVVEAPKPDRWRLAVLDRYDGSGWSSAADYRAAGQRLPPDLDRGGGDPERVEQTVTIRGLRGVWLPAAARPVEITGVGVLVDPASGVLARPDGVGDGLRYRVASERVPFPDCTVATANGPSATPIPTSEANSQLLQNIATKSSEITALSTSPCQRARAIESYLRENYEVDPEATAGSHLRRINDFLTVPGRNRGTAEQFASAFALLGRNAGLPTRVVVGFQPGEQQAGGGWLVRGGDAFAWPEVRFDGVGWMAFEPTPIENDVLTPPDEIDDQESQTEDPLPDASGGEGPRVVERSIGVDQDMGAGTSTIVRVLTGIGAAAVVLGLVVGLLVAVATAGRRRRRHRRQTVAGTRARVVGAWWEALDALSDRGLDSDRARTAAQWAAAGRDLVDEPGTDTLGELAHAVNAALFAAVAPDDHEVDRAWALADAVGIATRRGMRRTQRWRYRLDPRPWLAVTPDPIVESVWSPREPLLRP